MKKIDDIYKVGENRRFSCQRVIEVGNGSFEVKYRAAGGAAQSVTWTICDAEKLFLANGDLIRMNADGKIITIIGRAALSTVARLP